jgi:hypothetical protein
MPDDTKIFDVSKPGRTAAQPTSRPIIVDQNSTGIDNMVKDYSQPNPAPNQQSATPIHVSMADEAPTQIMTQPANPEMSTIDAEQGQEVTGQNENSQVFHPPTGATIPPHELDEQPKAPAEKSGGSNFTPLSSLIPNANSKEDSGEYGSHHVDKLPESHPGNPGYHEVPPLSAAPGAGPKRRLAKFFGWLIVLAVLAVVGGFLAVDAGLVKSDVKLPFHIFNKQKTSKTAASTTVVKTSKPSTPPPVQSTVPTGFTKYAVSETSISFAYPTVWGAATVAKDPGFSKRGGTNKTDGTYAYKINFAANKDIEVALTSSKYLPASRGALYYDFLDWCSGTNDNKFYKNSLHFTSQSGVDTPGTIACDQGPLTDATKIDDTTIMQQKTKDSSGAILGDLYTKNLTANKEIPVLRVKDSTMKNSEDIKKVLATIKTNDSKATSNQIIQ